MNKIKSARIHLVKFLFILPLLGVLLVAFRNRYESGMQVKMQHPAVSKEVLAMTQKTVLPALATIGRGRPYVAGGKVVVADTTKPLIGVVQPLIGEVQPLVGEVMKDPKDTAFPDKVLFVMDGEVKSPGFSRDSIDATKIYAMEVLKGEQALKFYGEKGKNGVVIITTKEFMDRHKPATRFGIPPDSAHQPLFIVDGVEMPHSAAPLQKLNPDDIESISVIKDDAAKVIYGEKGKNGVIIITMKKKTSYQPKITIYGKDGPMSGMADTIRMKVNGESVVITADKLAEH